MDKWTLCNKLGDSDAIMKEFGFSAVTARLLINRGITDPDEIRRFISPCAGDLHSPHLMMNLDGAVELTAEKIRAGKKIRIIGDYDVDGIMATYILTDALRLAGADEDWYIPHRIRDGYGLNVNLIRSAAEDGVDTVITCDNGIAAVDASLEASELGLTLIVTDHHEIPEVLPKATFIVDPKQENDNYPCRDICGAVVAAKFAAALFEYMGIGKDISRYLEYMAMATICDVVALVGENRAIARLGMEALKTTSNPGLANLMRETGIAPEEINEYYIGFVMGPCFNATGRIDDAGMAFELLDAKTEEQAARLALECKNLNEERKVMTAQQEAFAFSKLDALGENLPKVIVLEMPDCHESILGIIAGRIKERYNRPAIAVTRSGENYKGSARSVPEYNMFAELNRCSEYLVRFGGHPMAAGLTICNDKLDEFTEALNRNCVLTEEEMCRRIRIDIEAGFQLFDEKTIKEINLFAPFGQSNAAPLFAERDLQCRSIRRIGKEGNYLRFKFINSYGYEITATCFQDSQAVMEKLIEKYGRQEVENAERGGTNSIRITAAYVPRLNEYRDNKEIQMNIKALRI